MTSKISNASRQAMAGGSPKLCELEVAVQALASCLGAPMVNVTGTPISTFRSRYTEILNRVRAGAIEVVTQNGEPFVLLGWDHVVALSMGVGHTKTAAELLEGLPSFPPLSRPLRFQSILRPSHHRVPPEPLEAGAAVKKRLGKMR